MSVQRAWYNPASVIWAACHGHMMQSVINSMRNSFWWKLLLASLTGKTLVVVVVPVSRVLCNDREVKQARSKVERSSGLPACKGASAL